MPASRIDAADERKLANTETIPKLRTAEVPHVAHREEIISSGVKEMTQSAVAADAS